MQQPMGPQSVPQFRGAGGPERTPRCPGRVNSSLFLKNGTEILHTGVRDTVMET